MLSLPRPSRNTLASRPHRRLRIFFRLALLCASAAFASASASAQVFTQPVTLTDSGTGGTAVADFNGDGKPDIAAADGGNAFGGSLGVYFGNGDGTFGARQSYPTPSNTLTIATADFNLDGKPDLALANFAGTNEVASVFLNNGDGTFKPRVDFQLSADGLPREIHVADFNADSKPDLFVLTHDLVNVLIGNGDGTFQQRRTFGAGLFPTSAAAGDFNGDGKADVAVAGEKVGSPTDSRVTIMLGDGAGGFSSSNDFTCGFGPQVVLARDFNNDGKLDLVTNNSRDQTLSVLLGKGDGTFQPKVDTPARVFLQMQSMEAADVDGDGKLDAVTGVPDGFAVSPGRGDGTFGTPRLFGGTESSGARWMNLGDLDRDNKPDVLAGDFNGGALRLYLNRSGPRTVSGTVRDDSGSPLAGASLTLAGAGLGAAAVTTGADGVYSLGGLPSDAALTLTPSKRNYDFVPPSRSFDSLPSDATTDFTGTLRRFNITGVVADNLGNRRRGATVTLGGGASATTVSGDDGSYTFKLLPANLSYTLIATLPRYSFFPRFVNDLSSDVVVNLVGSPQRFKITGAVHDATQAFPTWCSGVTFTLSGSVSDSRNFDQSGQCFFDFEFLPVGGDYTVNVSQNLSGKLFTDRILLQPTSRRIADLEADASVNFEGLTLSAPTGAEPKYVVTADFDRDGKADVAVSNAATGTEQGSIAVLLGNGDGTLKPETRIGVGEVPAGLLTGDFDKDGRADLALASTSGRDVSVYLGNGDGTFKPRAGYEVDGGPTSFASGDFNGDGKTDLVIIGTLNPDSATQGPGMRVLLNKGDGTFEVGGFRMFTALPRQVRAGDFNGDGKTDLVFANSNTTVSLLLSNGDGTFGPPADFNIGGVAAPRHVEPGDFNGDGKLDLLVLDDAFGSNNGQTLLGKGDGTFNATARFLGGVDPIAVADYNGDGKLDYLSAPLLNDHVMGVRLGNGDGTFTPSPQAIDSGFRIRGIAAGDFNGDGKMDAVHVRPSASFAGSASPRNVGVLLNVGNSPAFQFNASNYSVNERDGSVAVTVTRAGDLSSPASVSYSTGNGTADDRGDYTAALGTLRFAAGESSKTFNVLVTADALAEGSETFTVALGSPSGAALGTPSVAFVTIANDANAPATPNPVEDSAFFVRQHYRDFLNREPDASGLAFWVNQIESCGTGAQCREVRRIHVSAAFFLAIEFQETGYLVYRLNQAAFNTGERLRLRSFLPDTQEVGRGVVVGVAGWEELLESNKQAFVGDFVSRPAFVAAYPASMTPAQFVDALNANTLDPQNPAAGGALNATERDQLVASLASAGNTTQARASVLRAVAENAEFTRRQKNRAFVLMQYFGYLRRDPNDPPDIDYSGHAFWLKKLDDNNGDFVRAEMVKAFLSSDEYRKRFGR